MAEDRKKGSKGTKKPREECTGTPLPAGFTVQDTTALPRTAQQDIPRPPQLRGSDSDEEHTDTLPDPATARIYLAPEERYGAKETVDLGRVPTQPLGTVTQPFYGFQREPEAVVPFTKVFEETSGDIGALVVDESRSLTPAAPEPTQSFAVRDVRPSIPPFEGIVLEVKATPADPDLPYALTVAAEEPGTREYNRMADVRIRDTARLETPREDHPAHRKTPAVQLVPDPSPKEHTLNRGIVYDALRTLYQQSDVLASALRDSQLPDRLYIAQQRFWKGQLRQPELLLQYLVNHPDVRESGLSDELRGFLDVMSYERERKQQMVAAETAGEIPAVRTAVAEPELPPIEHPRHPLLLPPDLTLQRTGVEEFRGPQDLEGYQPGIPQEMIGTPLVGTFTPTSGETGVHAMPVEQSAQPVQPLAAELAGEPTHSREIVSGLKVLPFGAWYEEVARAGEMGSEALERALKGAREREALPAEQEIFSLQVIPPRPSVSPDLVRIIDETLLYLHRGTREVSSPPAIKYLTDGKAKQREDGELFAFLDGMVERVEGEAREHQRMCDELELLIFGIDTPKYPIPMGIERQRIAGEGDYFYLGRNLTMEELTRLSEAVWRLRRIKNQQEGAEREQERRKRTLEGFFGPQEEAAEKSRKDHAYGYLMKALEHGMHANDYRFLAEDPEIVNGKKTIRERRLEEYGAALRDLHTVWKLRPDTPFLQRKRIGYTTEILDLMDHAEQEGDTQSYQAGVHALEYREGNWDFIATQVLGKPYRTVEKQHPKEARDHEAFCNEIEYLLSNREPGAPTHQGMTGEGLGKAIEVSKRRYWERQGFDYDVVRRGRYAHQFVAKLIERAQRGAERLLPAPQQREADLAAYRPDAEKRQQERKEARQTRVNVLQGRIKQVEVYEARTPLILSREYGTLNQIMEFGDFLEPNYRPLKFGTAAYVLGTEVAPISEYVLGVEVVPELPARQQIAYKDIPVSPLVLPVAPREINEGVQLSFEFPAVIQPAVEREERELVRYEKPAVPVQRQRPKHRTITPQEAALAAIAGIRIPFVVGEEAVSEETIAMTDADIVSSELVAVEQPQLREEIYVLTDAVVDSIMPLEEIQITAEEVPLPTRFGYQEVAGRLLAEARETEEIAEGRQTIVDLITTFIPKKEAEEAYHRKLLEAYLAEERKQEAGDQLELDFTGSLARAQEILDCIPTHAPEEMYSVTLVRDRFEKALVLFKIDDLVLYGDPNSGELTRLPQGMPQIPWISHERLEKEEVTRVLQHYANTKPAQFARYIGDLLGVKGERQISQLPRVSQEEQRTDEGLEVVPLTKQDIEFEVIPAQTVSPPPLPAQVFEPTPEERAYLATFDMRVALALEGRDYDAVMNARKVFMATVRTLEAVEESRRVRALPAPQHREANIGVYHPQQTVPAYVAQPAVRTLIQIVDQSLRIMNSGGAVEEIKYRPSGDPAYAAFEHAIMQRDWYASAQQETALIAERLEVLARQKEERQTIVDLMGARIAQLEADPTLYFREQAEKAWSAQNLDEAVLWYERAREMDGNNIELLMEMALLYEVRVRRKESGSSEAATERLKQFELYKEALKAAARKEGLQEHDILRWLVTAPSEYEKVIKEYAYCISNHEEVQKTLDHETIINIHSALVERWKESNPESAATFIHRLARIKYENNDLTGAAREARRLEALGKTSLHASYLCGSTYIRDIQKDTEALVAEFLERAEWNIQQGEKYRKHEGFYGIIGNAEEEAQIRYQAARFLFESILEYDPEHKEAKTAVADLEAKLSELEQRQKEKAEERPEQPDADYYFDRGLKAHEQERLLPAEMWYKAALKADPEHVLTLTNQGLIALEQGEYDRSLELQLKAVDASAEKAEVPEGTEKSADKLDYAPAVVKLHLADAYAAKEDATKAIDTYKRILKEHAGTAYEVDAFMSLAEVARSKGDTTMAMHYLDDAREAAEQLGMRTHQIDYDLGVLLQQRGHVESARQSYEDAVEGSPKGEREPTYENRSSRLVEGFALNNLGVLTEGRKAEEYFAQAMQANPSNVLAMTNWTQMQH